jgi:hypothetical protein
MRTLTKTTAAFLAIALTGTVLASTVSTAEAGPRTTGGLGITSTDLGSGRGR